MNIKKHLSATQKRKLYKVLNLLSDKTVIKLQYFASLGRRLNLKNPQRFTEKLDWYKLYYRDPLMTQCADKYELRFYLQEKGYGQYVPKLYQVCNTFDDIDFESLPNCFAIKCNNGSGTNLFIKEKADINIDELRATVESWHEVNTINIGREWAYHNIKQKIVVEELLVSQDGTQIDDLNDYKILCFNGKAKVICLDMDRHTEHKRNFYDIEWNNLNILSDCPNCTKDLPKPYGFEKMLEISQKIAKDFPFVRVDFYSLNQKIYIGELTFYPWSACVQFTPDSFDFELGKYFTLPAPLNAVD